MKNDLSLLMWHDEENAFRLHFQSNKNGDEWFMDLSRASLVKLVTAIADFHDNAPVGAFDEIGFDLTEEGEDGT